ncbi:MAG: hypothetical protein KAT34_10265 [Candidatus Aminicenantes bacterium]|jgi:hypothetical protein|nr:hypothetical protein [Candidatus Aminicenantes bacterium]
MQKNTFLIRVLTILLLGFNSFAAEDYLNITAEVIPRRIKQGEEGVLTLKITPINDIRISSHPKFMIRLNPNDNLIFSKLFFTASELNVETTAENNMVYLNLEKKNEITFKVRESALIGQINISGGVIFTAVFKDNWSMKTHQSFNVGFFSIRNQKIKKK